MHLKFSYHEDDSIKGAALFARLAGTRALASIRRRWRRQPVPGYTSE